MITAAGLLSPNVGLIVWVTISFLALLFILKRYAWGPITSAMNEREVRITESMEQAERALAEARQLQEDNTRARREAEADAQRLLREARETTEQLRAEEVEKTKAQLRHMQEQAQQDIEREKDSALDALRQEVADLAIQAAEKILQDTLDADRQRKIVDDFLGDLSRN